MKKGLLFIVVIFFTISAFGQSALNDIVINEVQYRSNPEFIELYNTSSTTTVDIGSWEIYDNSTSRSIGSGTMLGPEGFYVENFNSRFNNDGDQIILYDPNTNTYIALVYGGFSLDLTDLLSDHPGATQVGSTENAGTSTSTTESFQRSPDGSATFIVATPTPGASLPVELIAFEINLKNNQSHLTWQTASEINNSHFQIEHSTTGQDFETIGEIDGAGTTFEVQNYSFIHEAPMAGINYYRLKQVDFDGNFEYSQTKSIMVKGAEDWNLRPTQSREELIVNWSEDFSAKTVSVFDLNGKLVFDKKLDFESEQLRIETSNFSVGTYILKMQTDRTVSSKRFFKIQ